MPKPKITPQEGHRNRDGRVKRADISKEHLKHALTRVELNLKTLQERKRGLVKKHGSESEIKQAVKKIEADLKSIESNSELPPRQKSFQKNEKHSELTRLQKILADFHKTNEALKQTVDTISSARTRINEMSH